MGLPIQKITDGTSEKKKNRAQNHGNAQEEEKKMQKSPYAMLFVSLICILRFLGFLLLLLFFMVVAVTF